MFTSYSTHRLDPVPDTKSRPPLLPPGRLKFYPTGSKVQLDEYQDLEIPDGKERSHLPHTNKLSPETKRAQSKQKRKPRLAAYSTDVPVTHSGSVNKPGREVSASNTGHKANKRFNAERLLIQTEQVDMRSSTWAAGNPFTAPLKLYSYNYDFNVPAEAGFHFELLHGNLPGDVE